MTDERLAIKRWTCSDCGRVHYAVNTPLFVGTEGHVCRRWAVEPVATDAIVDLLNRNGENAHV